MNATAKIAFPLTEEQIALIERNPAKVHPSVRDHLLQEQQSLAEEITRLKDREMRLRKACVAVLFPEQASDVNAEGTENFELGAGYIAKCTFKQSYKLDPKNTKGAENALRELGPEGMFIAERVFKWKPELSVSEYRKLPPACKPIVDGVLTITPGAPEFKILPPKS